MLVIDLHDQGYKDNKEIMRILINGLKTLAYLAIVDVIIPNQRYCTDVFISCSAGIQKSTIQKLIPGAYVAPVMSPPSSWRACIREKEVVQGTFHEWGTFPTRTNHNLAYANMRDQALFGEPYDESIYQGGIRYFDGLNKDKLDYLLVHGFIDQNDYSNNSPCVSEFREFLEKYPKATLHGFADSIQREYCGIVITGCSCHGKLTKQFIIDFCNAFRLADEFNISDCCCSCTYD